MRALFIQSTRFFRNATARVLVAMLVWSFAGLVRAESLRPERLRCEYRVGPSGMDVTRPRLSWSLTSDERSQVQTAYQVIVSSSEALLERGQGDLWDTGKVDSDRTAHVVYAGKPLGSRMRAWWKVRVWDKGGRQSGWSEAARWTMGLLEGSDWRAKWISQGEKVAAGGPGRPHNGYHSEFAGAASATKRVSLDLGQATSFAELRLFPARPYDWQPDTPGFLFPLGFKVEAASRPDFSDGRLILDRTGADEPNPGTNAAVYTLPETQARFVRLTVTRLRERDAGKFAFALAELQLLKDGLEVSRSAAVAVSDSIETGPWSTNNLTDGICGTVKPGTATALPATMARKAFRVPGPIRRATAYVSALGLYELRLNGRRVGDQLLSPEWTSYRKRVSYQTYDVSGMVQRGDNVVSALIGEGWFAGRLMLTGPFPYGTTPQLLVQLELESADGSVQHVVSDSSWRTTVDGPIRAAGIYDGETYDARKEMNAWEKPGFDDSAWKQAQTMDLDYRRLVWLPNEPIRVVRELKPVRVTEPKPGVYVFDLGQNMVGWCRVRAHGNAGQTITIRHAEMVNEDGTIYTANLRGAPQVDRYTPRLDGAFTYEPRFTYHGFRYVEITGLAKPPSVSGLIGRVFHSAAPITGTFECSDASLNRLMQNILWTQRGNLMSSPNDCPQRDERFGWMGDIQSFGQTAIFNMDLGAFLTKFVQDIRDDQADDGRFPDFAPHAGDPNKTFSGAPAWADAGVIVPWRAWQNYADERLLAGQFDAACRWVEYIRRNNPDLVWSKGRNNDYNDWLNGDWVKQKGWPEKGGSVPNEVFATAFFAHSTDLVARMAKVLGKTEEAKGYSELFEQIKAVFNQRFVQPDGRIQGDTQGGYALALAFDLLPRELRPKAAQLLVANIQRYNNHLSTGIQTTHRAMQELVRNNQADVGWQLLTNRTFPSWLYMIDNGATTIWERWDGYVKGRGFQDAGMNSFNHWAFGAVGEWMWRQIGGLNPDEAHPGWKHFTIAPRPGGGVTSARAEYQSIRGRIASEWQIRGQNLNLRVTVPPNTTATVVVPKSAGGMVAAKRPEKRNQAASLVRSGADADIYDVGSGTYSFSAPFTAVVLPSGRSESDTSRAREAGNPGK